MKIESRIFNQIANIALRTKEEFREIGVVIPTTNERGRIKIGRYIIDKNSKGYFIQNSYDEVVYSEINLPQTALLVANSLALGKVVNQNILNYDIQHGFSEFEELNYQRLSKNLMHKKDWERYQAILIKQELAQERAEFAKKEIQRAFAKLYYFDK